MKVYKVKYGKNNTTAGSEIEYIMHVCKIQGRNNTMDTRNNWDLNREIKGSALELMFYMKNRCPDYHSEIHADYTSLVIPVIF